MAAGDEFLSSWVPEQPYFYTFWISNKDALSRMGLECFTLLLADENISKTSKDLEVRDIWSLLLPSRIRDFAIQGRSMYPVPSVDIAELAQAQNNAESLASTIREVAASAISLFGCSAAPFWCGSLGSVCRLTMPWSTQN